MDSVIKSIIDRMWNNFWEGGVTNPLTVIEQITYLDVRIDIWTHFMRECIINYVH